MKKWIPPLLLLSGCMVGPNYQPPESCVSDTWNAQTSENRSEPVEQKWWEAFQDDLLTKYVGLAASQNYDIQTAEANILKARALRQIAASSLFPQVIADVNGTKTYFSKNGPVFAIGQAAGNPGVTTSPLTGLPFVVQMPQIQNLYNALFDASWELDFFGKTRRSVESATAEYESLIDQRNNVLLTVLAEVARNYIDLRSFQERVDLLQANIRLYEENAKIVEAQLHYGYSNQLDLETIEAQLAAARAALPDANAEIYRAIYTLSILIGQPPETLVDELLPKRVLPRLPQEVAVGLRSDLLRRRPDIRYAERKLAEATANIGVAVASFFPTISLLANGGFQSLVLPQLFEWGSRTWAWGADVNMPVFQGGKLVGNLHLSRAEEAAAAATYQQTVLSALQDAETSLKTYQEKMAATKQYSENVLHNQYVVTLTRERYLKGLINQIDLLNNEKTLVSSKLTELDSKTGELLALISLYKSLGGGWEAETENSSNSPNAIPAP
jgi:NodT family efflux transporter outer membrane factor (OMF) lipoprotein